MPEHMLPDETRHVTIDPLPEQTIVVKAGHDEDFSDVGAARSLGLRTTEAIQVMNTIECIWLDMSQARFDGDPDLPLYEDWIQLKRSPWNLVRLTTTTSWISAEQWEEK